MIHLVKLRWICLSLSIYFLLCGDHMVFAYFRIDEITALKKLNVISFKGNISQDPRHSRLQPAFSFVLNKLHN